MRRLPSFNKCLIKLSGKRWSRLGAKNLNRVQKSEITAKKTLAESPADLLRVHSNLERDFCHNQRIQFKVSKVTN